MGWETPSLPPMPDSYRMSPEPSDLIAPSGHKNLWLGKKFSWVHGVFTKRHPNLTDLKNKTS